MRSALQHSGSRCAVRARSTGPQASATTTQKANMAAQRQSLRDSFVAGKPWAQTVLDMQKGVMEQIQAQVEPVQLQPTKYSDSASVSAWSLDGKSEFTSTTYSGTIIRHMYQSSNFMSAFGILHTKTGVHACMEQGTPFLDVELVGNERSVLLALFLTPRQSTLRHLSYLDKYYRSLPPSAGEGILPFAQVYARMLGRVEVPVAPGVAIISDVDGKAGRDAANAGKVYTHFHSRQLFTRMMSGHGVLFSFNPTLEGSVAAVKEDLAALVAIWCAWAKADSTQPALGGAQLQECKEMSRNLANYLDLDEDAAMAEKMIGVEGTRMLRETVSGAASLAGTPWWSS